MSTPGFNRPSGLGHTPLASQQKGVAPTPKAAKFRELNELKAQLKEYEIKVGGRFLSSPPLRSPFHPICVHM